MWDVVEPEAWLMALAEHARSTSPLQKERRESDVAARWQLFGVHTKNIKLSHFYSTFILRNTDDGYKQTMHEELRDIQR